MDSGDSGNPGNPNTTIYNIGVLNNSAISSLWQAAGAGIVRFKMFHECSPTNPSLQPMKTDSGEYRQKVEFNGSTKLIEKIEFPTIVRNVALQIVSTDAATGQSYLRKVRVLNSFQPLKLVKFNPLLPTRYKSGALVLSYTYGEVTEPLLSNFDLEVITHHSLMSPTVTYMCTSKCGETLYEEEWFERPQCTIPCFDVNNKCHRHKHM